MLKLELPAPVTGRLAVLDELKGLAIILVILYHAGGVLVWSNDFHGDVGVDIFVILSGIGLAFGSRYDGAPAFLARRLSRIMPTYWIVLTAYLICDVHFLNKSYTGFNLVVHYLGIQGWFGDFYGMDINDSFWYVTLILSLYLVYCVFHGLMNSPGRLLLAGAALSLTVALLFFHAGQSGMFSHLGLRLPGFFVGLLIGRLLKDGRLDIEFGPSLVLAAFLLTYVPYTQGVIFYSYIVGLALMGGYVFGWKRIVPAIVERTTAVVLQFLGVLSLEIFLIHQPLIRDYNYYLHSRWLHDSAPSVSSRIAGMAIGVAVTLVISFELNRLVRKIPLPGRSRA